MEHKSQSTKNIYSKILYRQSVNQYSKDVQNYYNDIQIDQLGGEVLKKNKNFKIIKSEKQIFDQSQFKNITIEEIIDMYDQNQISFYVCRKVIKNKIVKEENEINRNKFWITSIQIQQSKQVNQNDYYEKLKNLKFPFKFKQQIDKDIRRTLDENFLDIEKKDQLIQNMGEILNNYSKRNSYVGYCQGLNYLVYFLLQNEFSNEDCFWILGNLIENIIPINYFSSMEDVMVDMMILNNLVSQQIPELFSFFQKKQIDLGIISFRWFICLFTNSQINFKIVQIIWDFLFLEGSSALFKASLIILMKLKNKIQTAYDFANAYLIIENNISKIQNSVKFRKQMQSFYIGKNTLKILRQRSYEVYYKQRLKEIEMRQKIRKQKQKKQENYYCSDEYSICVYNLIDPLVQTQDFFIYKTENKIRIDLNYMVDLKQNQNVFYNDQSLLITRFDHICQKDDNYFYQKDRKLEKEQINDQDLIIIQRDEEKTQKYENQQQLIDINFQQMDSIIESENQNKYTLEDQLKFNREYEDKFVYVESSPLEQFRKFTYYQQTGTQKDLEIKKRLELTKSFMFLSNFNILNLLKIEE